MVNPDPEQLLKDGLYDFPDKSSDTFGWYQICESTFKHIRAILPEGKTVLELGSGWGTTQLAKHYKVVTVEDNPRWLNRDPTVEYIHASLDPETGWYNTEILKRRLPKEYDFLIVDGPGGAFKAGRRGFFDNLGLFRQDVTILFDDLHFIAVYNTFMRVALKLGRVPFLYPGDITKNYGVIYTDR